jgi:hypothetical protein
MDLDLGLALDRDLGDRRYVAAEAHEVRKTAIDALRRWFAPIRIVGEGTMWSKSCSQTRPTARSCIPHGQKIDTQGSGVPPIFECQITSYDRPPSGERFENLSPRSVQIRAHDWVRIRSRLLPGHAPTCVEASRLPLKSRLRVKSTTEASSSPTIVDMISWMSNS